MLKLVPMSLKRARLYITAWHRHHAPPTGGLFAIGVELIEETSLKGIAGVAIVGRPVARAFDDGFTAEVIRLATNDTPHVASKLYAACWRACRAMGYRRLISYTLATETGTSLKAAGWRELYTTRDRAGGWNTPARPRASGPAEPKTLWEITA